MDISNFIGNFLHTSMGIGGFKNEIRLSESINLNSDAPDNPVEDGSIIQDHIINQPLTLEINGEVADIHRRGVSSADKVSNIIDRASNIFNTIAPLTKTPSMKQTMSTISSIVPIPSNISSIFGMFGFSSSPQQDFFNYIETMHLTKQLITIQTPFKTYENMRITAFSVTRDNTTDMALTYSINAKQVTFAKTLMVAAKGKFPAPAKTGNATRHKISKRVNKGTNTGGGPSTKLTTKKGTTTQAKANEDKSFIWKGREYIESHFN